MDGTFYIAKLGSIGDDAPEWIQYMPPGTHTIRPTESSTGNVVERTVVVEASGVDALNRSLEENLSKTGDFPFIDFNHDDNEAAGFVKAFRWAGDDPTTGGIHAQIEWTEPGRSAVKGRAYRRFSPSFRVDESGRVTGAPVNTGGLVNRAAFHKISALWSKGQGNNNGKDNTMDIETLKAKVSTLEGENQTLKAKLAQANQDEVLKAKDAQILQHQTEVQTLKAKLAEQEENAKKQRATDLVAAAVKDGRIPPKDTVLQAKWVETLTSSPAAEELLAKLSPSSVVPGTIITGQAGKGGHKAGENEFMAKAKEFSVKQNLELGQAIGLMAKEDPAGYEDYRKSIAVKV